MDRDWQAQRGVWWEKSSRGGKYRCPLDENSLDLYADVPGADKAAREIAKALTRGVNRALDELQWEKGPSGVPMFAPESLARRKKLASRIRDTTYLNPMERFAEWGARDSEPEGVVVEELIYIFDLRGELERWD